MCAQPVRVELRDTSMHTHTDIDTSVCVCFVCVQSYNQAYQRREDLLFHIDWAKVRIYDEMI